MLPAASIHRPGLAQRLVARVLQPPRWAASPSSWALSAASCALALHLITLLARDGRLGLLYELTLTPSAILVSLISFLAVAMPLFIPLRISAGLYFLLFPRPTRRAAVVWTVSFHALAHMAALGLLCGEPLLGVHVPLFVGALWGAWLPRTRDHEPERDLRSWLRPSGW